MMALIGYLEPSGNHEEKGDHVVLPNNVNHIGHPPISVVFNNHCDARFDERKQRGLDRGVA